MANNKLSRRRFISTSMVSAAALAGTSKLRADEPKNSDSDEIRCGLIGPGGRGTSLLDALVKIPTARITALCDIDEKNLNNAAETAKEHNPKLFKDYRKMLEYKELDAVFVATPCYLHKEMFVAVMQSGRHCYGEKPMALTVPDLNEVVKVTKATKKVFQIGTQLRYDKTAMAGIKAIREGKIGKPVFIYFSRHNSWDINHENPWLYKRVLSGDMIVEQAVHEFDQCNWIFEKIPARIAGFGGQAVLFEPKGRDLMDHYSLSIDYGKDKKASYSHTWIAGQNAPINNIKIAILGSKGTLDLMKATIYPRSKDKEIKPISLPTEGKKLRDIVAIESFFDCCQTGKTPLANVETGRDAALVALLGRKALDEERVVTMKELLAEG